MLMGSGLCGAEILKPRDPKTHRPHHANTSRHIALAADTTAHHLQNRAHGF